MAGKLDLDGASSPRGVADVLQRAAQQYFDDAEQLATTWQDPQAGKPWELVAAELDRSALRIRERLKKWGYTGR